MYVIKIALFFFFFFFCHGCKANLIITGTSRFYFLLTCFDFWEKRFFAKQRLIFFSAGVTLKKKSWQCQETTWRRNWCEVRKEKLRSLPSIAKTSGFSILVTASKLFLGKIKSVNDIIKINAYEKNVLLKTAKLDTAKYFVVIADNDIFSSQKFLPLK